MRQYSVTADRSENCRVGVFLTCPGPKGFTVIDRELYTPKEWADDSVRCREVEVPEGVEFRTKPLIALEIRKSAKECEIPFSWVTADSVYGDCRGISNWLESIEKGYVLAVYGKEYV